MLSTSTTPGIGQNWVCTELFNVPTWQHASRGTSEPHASRNAIITANAYNRSGGASIQEWLLTFPESYSLVEITEINNAVVRWATWGEQLQVGQYQRNGSTLWIGGGRGVVAVRWRLWSCDWEVDA
ncbi:MAG: hypothetical protein AAGA46_00535 [Cyanobacteria bacterium P01_F01_bin.13]